MWVKVQGEGARSIKLTWGNDIGPFCAYAVGAATVAKQTDKLRAQLDQLARWALSPTPDALPMVLHEIATAGSLLRYALFEASDYPDLDEFLHWRDEQYAAGDRTLYVVSDPNLYVPWGLLFEGDPAAIRDGGDQPSDYAGFWIYKYNLATLLSGCTPASTMVSRPRSSFRLLSVIDREVYDDVCGQLTPALRERLDRLLQHPVGVAFSLEDCDHRVREAATMDTLFHFLGHCEDGSLIVGPGQTIDSLRLRMIMDRLSDRRSGRVNSRSLLFLNGCSTAEGDADYSLRSAAARPGSCGYIATEAVVPTQFAAVFGLLFLDAIVQGRSVGEAMTALRQDLDLWPTSLLYGCYAYPDYRIQPAS